MQSIPNPLTNLRVDNMAFYNGLTTLIYELEQWYMLFQSRVYQVSLIYFILFFIFGRSEFDLTT